MDRVDPQGRLAARRLFARVLPVAGAEAELGLEAAQHAHVLRLGAGDRICLFDGRGASTLAEVIQLSKRSLLCRELGPRLVEPRTTRVVLVQCVPKGSKLDDIVRMTTELGVAQVALASSERCVSRISEGTEKAERLHRIAVEAARQSEQPYVPEVVAPRPLAEVLASAPEGAFRAAFVERSGSQLPAELSAPEIWLVVGPEGGLSPADRELLAAHHFQPFGLGSAILRTETAAVVGVALALDRSGRCR